MKKLILTTALVAACASAFAQGTLTFANAGPGCVFKIFDSDGTTPLAGSGFMADLFWAPGTVTDSTLLMALNAPAIFNTGAQAGYFTGGQRTIPGQPGGSVITVQVRVWNTPGAIFTGWTLGESALAQITLGQPPGTPPYMTGLNGKSFQLSPVPEPSTFALAGLGFAGMLVAQLRNKRVRAPKQRNNPAATSPAMTVVGHAESRVAPVR